MTRVDEYRQRLRTLDDWEPYLRRESGLPGPRGNLELAEAVSLEISPARISDLLEHARAAPNSPEEFLLFCGLVSLGRKGRRGGRPPLAVLRRYASDPRWRIREAVAIALQYWGDDDLEAMIEAMESWAAGSRWEMRAVTAALAEPRLLRRKPIAGRVVRILDQITRTIRGADDRSSEGFRVLRQSLGYAWSVVAVAAPEKGRRALERWAGDLDPDIRWIVKENLGKNRIRQLGESWLRQVASKVGAKDKAARRRTREKKR
jgi:hypothetical protein